MSNGLEFYYLLQKELQKKGGTIVINYPSKEMAKKTMIELREMLRNERNKI